MKKYHYITWACLLYLLLLTPVFAQWVSSPLPGNPIDNTHPWAQNLKAYWPTWAGGGYRLEDISGNNNHGVLNDYMSWKGTALDFPVSNSTVTLTDLNTTAFTQISVGMWIKTRVWANWKTIIGRTDSSAWDDGWGLAASTGGNVIFWVDHYNDPASVNLTTTNEWLFLVGTYDGTNQKIYLNGVLQDTEADAWGNHSAATPVIGQVVGGTAIDGYISGLFIYDIALTAEEIMERYRNPLAIFQKFDVFQYFVPTIEGVIPNIYHHRKQMGN